MTHGSQLVVLLEELGSSRRNPAVSLTVCLFLFVRPAAPNGTDDAGWGAPAGDNAGPAGHPSGPDPDTGAAGPTSRKEATHGLHLSQL